MQIKKILGILLALCFLMSVTVAAVSAEPVKNKGDSRKMGDDRKVSDDKRKDDDRKMGDDKRKDDDRKMGDDKRKDDDRKMGDDKRKDDDRKKNDDNRHKEFVNAHWEYHKIAKKEIRNHRVVIIYKIVRIFVPSHWRSI